MSEWEALRSEAAELSLTPVRDTALRRDYGNYPGFKRWLVSQFALGITTRMISERLTEILADQSESGEQPWPSLNKRSIDDLRGEWREEWEVARSRINATIETQGVLSKNNRLLALLRTAEELEDRMWTDRNAKSGQLYLIKDYLGALKQIAEEKGELGETENSNESALVRLSQTLADALRVQGSGVQVTVLDAEFDYEEEGEYQEDSIPGESGDLQGDGLQA